MNIAKLSKKDIDGLVKFSQACDLVLERDKWSSMDAHERWQELDEDDKDRLEIQQIKDSLCRNEELEPETIDGRIIAYEFLKRRMSSRLILAIISVDSLIDSCCDPTLKHLDFHPSFEQLHVAPEQ